MSSPSTSEGDQAVSATRCRVCGRDVPAGAFCGFCGAHLFRQPGIGPDWLRVRTYAAAPGEHVLRLSLVTSVFPHLPHRSRAAFRVGLAILVTLLVVLALLRWQAPLIGVSALGLPLLFQLYLQECDVYRDLPVRTLLLTAVGGVLLGVGWALLTGPIVAGSYLDATGAGRGSADTQLLWQGLAIPLGGALLMLVPVLVARVFAGPTRESLDGFLIGALGAVAFTAAAILTRLAPQLSTGLVAGERSVGGLLVEAGIDGVAVPLTAIAAGGMVGAALWALRRADPSRWRPALAALGLAITVVVVVYAGLGLIDVAGLRPGLQLGLHLLIAALAVLALRIGLHLALLHEAGEATQREPVPCPHCHHVVPDMPFCPNCGVAARASSRSARTARRASHPVLVDTTAQDAASSGGPVAVFPGYAVPPGSYAAPVVRQTSHTRLLVILGVGLAALVAVVGAVSVLATPAPVRYPCPPYCGRPPIGPPVGDPDGPEEGTPPAAPPSAAPTPEAQPPAPVPVQTYPRFTSADGGFSVAYSPRAEVTKKDEGLELRYPGIDGEIQLFGTPAENRTPLQIVEDYLEKHYPGADRAYQIPNAMVGYEAGYGEIDDFIPSNPNAKYQRERVLVMAAVKNGLALIATAHGPYKDFSPNVSNHPSGANLLIALLMSNSVNSFTWHGDSPR